jgi:outer membrane receptor protein involved in Fe transport
MLSLNRRKVMGNRALGIARLSAAAMIGASVCMVSGVHAQSVANGTRADTLIRVTVDVDHMPLRSALQSIARQAGLRLFGGKQVVDQTTSVSLHLREVPVDEAFAKALSGTGLQAEISGGSVALVVVVGNDAAAQGIVFGKVIDAKTKLGLRGAKVTLDDATKGVTSDEKGQFRFTGVAAGDHVVRVRLLGYVKAAKPVTVTDDAAVSVEIGLVSSTNQLEQVVVTGTVIPTELKAVPNAITIITAKELEEKGVTRIYDLFHGSVPGIFTSHTGQVGAVNPGKVELLVRGSTTFDDGDVGNEFYNSGIKTYVDGVELADKQYLGMIDPKNIERIEILTGPQASTIYGSNAINGVMQIFTKRGTTARPQVTVALRSAWTQNNFSSSVAPNYDLSTGLSGVYGRVSYNTGLSWLYTGSWTPSVRGQTLAGTVGGHVSTGPLTSDVSLRYTDGSNRSNGGAEQTRVERAFRGISNNPVGKNGGGGFGLPDNIIGATTDNALGVTETYALASWWSHALTLGVDRLANGTQKVNQTFSAPRDSSNSLGENTSQRLTAAYNTTLQVPLTALAKLTVTMGADESRSTNSGLFGQYVRYGDSYGYQFGVTRSHASEHGGFLQSQLGVWDAVFLTYGLRAVYNPNLGAHQNPNFEPRYGIAMTQAFGGITAKVYASYGASTRPPTLGQKDPYKDDFYIQSYGTNMVGLSNPDLVPESQQGGEGGLDLYLGTRGWLQVTHYNQTVDHLIIAPVVDSVDLLPDVRESGWCFGDTRSWRCPMYQTQNLNIGSIRNQGWTAVGQLNLGVLTAVGTYSWTKSRVIGVTQRYQRQFPQYVKGAAFALLAEHTWATDLTYAIAKTRIGVHVQGQGLSLGNANRSVLRLVNDQRLSANYLFRKTDIPDSYREMQPGMALGSLNVSQQITSRIEGLLDINNVANSYKGDYDPAQAQSGRTTSLGIRVRL